MVDRERGGLAVGIAAVFAEVPSDMDFRVVDVVRFYLEQRADLRD